MLNGLVRSRRMSSLEIDTVDILGFCTQAISSTIFEASRRLTTDA